MSPEVQKYYETYFDLFSTDGWKQFIKDMEDIHKQAIESAYLLNSSDDFFERKGNIHTYNYILNLEGIVDTNHQSILKEEEGVENAEDV